jgi:hypothetical protein
MKKDYRTGMNIIYYVLVGIVGPGLIIYVPIFESHTPENGPISHFFGITKAGRRIIAHGRTQVFVHFPAGKILEAAGQGSNLLLKLLLGNSG